MCVGTQNARHYAYKDSEFQSRTQHDVCWYRISQTFPRRIWGFNAARSIMYVGTGMRTTSAERRGCFNAARGIICVGTHSMGREAARGLFQCRTQHDVCWDSVVPSPCPTRATKVFWKVIRFRAVFAVKMRFSDERARGRSSLFLIRCGLHRFGKSQRRNVVCASLWIIFHFASITK